MQTKTSHEVLPLWGQTTDILIYMYLRGKFFSFRRCLGISVGSRNIDRLYTIVIKTRFLNFEHS